ncbi:hypothetical protein [Pedobacter antarcticus]|uniref:hypothetical protein n=1 Tax=Pedobacter antarcticus TaxID=34086 RepID=UPI000884350C|nr:hypothetical protein [Pedobacter antarcticus]SDL86111.1 hypothetical protein SAMN04488084_102704 [Pedobacter antarcticus]
MKITDGFIDFVKTGCHQVFKRNEGVTYRFLHPIVTNNNTELSLQYEIDSDENTGGFQVIVTLDPPNHETRPIRLKIFADPDTELNQATTDLIKADLLIVESHLNP